jgi:ketosteroid isomerase-like protein
VNLSIKSASVLLSGLFVLQMASTVPVMAAKPVIPTDMTASGIHVVGTAPDADEVNAILAVIQDMVRASNQHDLDGILKHYSPRFVSGDSLSLEEVQKLIQETWKTYPDISYETKTMEIRINGDWATVESLDRAKATAKPEASVSKGPGMLESRSRGLIFLKRVGKTWEIMSDYTAYESATILYGEAKDLKMVLSTPEQVFSGEPYSAKVDIQLPEGTFAIATISKEPLVYPQISPEEKFRSLSDEQDSLERVFQANKSNNNEMVTATVGLTQISQDAQERPTIKLNGIATIVKRVNVLPKSKFNDAKDQSHITRHSASGVIDLEKNPSPDKTGGDDEDGGMLNKESGANPQLENPNRRVILLPGARPTQSLN